MNHEQTIADKILQSMLGGLKRSFSVKDALEWINKQNVDANGNITMRLNLSTSGKYYGKLKQEEQ